MKRDLIKKTIYFSILLLIITAYIASLHIFDIKKIMHASAGEEEYYLEQLPKLIMGEPTKLNWPGYRVGLSALVLFGSKLTQLSSFNFIILVNFLLYVLLSVLLFWRFIPALLKKLNTKQNSVLNLLLCLVVLTNPVILKWLFSIHPDFIVFMLLFVIGYVMLISEGKPKTILLTILLILGLLFKEIILFLIPIIILYFIDEQGFNKKSVYNSLFLIICLFAVYFYVYSFLYHQKFDLILNKELPRAAFLSRLPGMFMNFTKNNPLFFITLTLYKMQMVYGLIWIFILLNFIKIQKAAKNVWKLLENYFYLLYPIALFLLATTSTGIAEKFLFEFSILPYFYMFLMKHKVDLNKVSKIKLVSIILFNVFNLVLYFWLMIRYYNIT